MFGLKRKLEKLELEFEQYKYDQTNLPIYKVGQMLSDGTIITKVEKQNHAFRFSFTYEINNIAPTFYTWKYEGVIDGVIIKVFEPTLIEDNYESLNDAIKMQCDTLNIHDATIHKLSYQVNNPPRYKLYQKVKEHGVCTNVELIPAEHIGDVIGYHYRYSFTGNNQTITVSE